MNTFSIQYETAKQNANTSMKKGDITGYLDALVKMSTYKRLMLAVIAN